MSTPSLLTASRRLIPAALFAQSPAPATSPTPAPTSATTSTAPDAPIALSPFEVNATLDVGYVGQDTLSGSRLRTNLKDIAAAISPMTAEFLREIALTGDVTVNTDSINEAIADTEALFYDNPHAFEGKRFVGDPLHNFNLRTRYDFRNGWAKGLSVGAGMRLRMGRIAGARTDYTYAPGSDLTSTWNGRVTDKVTLVEAKDQEVYDFQLGYSRTLSNRLRWELQLNINNVTNQRELIINNINGRTLQPLTYRYQDPRQFILTSTFRL